jgi:hypothetical protein
MAEAFEPGTVLASQLSDRATRARASIGAAAPGPWAATTVRLPLEYAFTTERPPAVRKKAPLPTPETGCIPVTLSSA